MVGRQTLQGHRHLGGSRGSPAPPRPKPTPQGNHSARARLFITTEKGQTPGKGLLRFSVHAGGGCLGGAVAAEGRGGLREPRPGRAARGDTRRVQKGPPAPHPKTGPAAALLGHFLNGYGPRRRRSPPPRAVRVSTGPHYEVLNCHEGVKEQAERAHLKHG